MNLAVRGLAANLGDVPADTFFKDQHPDLKADYIMANPPFNLKDWRGADELVDDSRWAGYEVPPTGNANYAWILHMVSKLSENGVAGFVLVNGSMSTNTTGEGAIRQKMLENDLVDCMIALPGQLFYTTQIPVCLWFLSKDKKGRDGSPSRPSYRNREGETLFIDARNMGSMISRPQKELDADDISPRLQPPITAGVQVGTARRAVRMMRLARRSSPTRTSPATANPPRSMTFASMTMCLRPAVTSAQLSWKTTAFPSKPR